MRRSTGFYVTHRVTGERFFLERSWKFDRWYFSADGWTTQATSRVGALRVAGCLSA